MVQEEAAEGNIVGGLQRNNCYLFSSDISSPIHGVNSLLHLALFIPEQQLHPPQPKLLVGVASRWLKCFLSFFLPLSFILVPLNKMTDALYSK